MYIDPPPTICICNGSAPEEPLDPIVRYWVTSKPYPMIHSEELTVGGSVNFVESYAPVYKTWPVDDGLKLSASLISLATKMAVQRATFAEDFQLSATLQSLQVRSAKVKLGPYDGFQLSASLLVLQVLGVVVKYTHQPETLNTTATITNLSFIDNSTNFPTTEAVTFDAGFSSIELISTGGGDPYWDNVVALLHFDGDLVDETGENTFYFNSLSSFSGGLFGQGINPSGDYRKRVQSDGQWQFLNGDPVTVELFFKATGSPASNAPIFISSNNINSNNSAFRRLALYQMTNNTIGIEYGTIGDVVVIDASLSNTDFQHLAFTLDSGDLKVFLDGRMVHEGPYPVIPTSFAEITLGGMRDIISVDARQRTIHGVIDELRITKGVARYTENFLPPTAPFPNHAPHGFPIIIDENATFMDECDSTEGWTVANGTLEVTNDWLRLTKTISGQSGIASKPISFTPTNKDWIAYFRVRCSRLGTNDTSYVWFVSGSTYFEVALNRTSTGYSPGSATLWYVAPTGNKTSSVSGLATDTGIDLAMHYDSSFSQLNLFIREPLNDKTVWKFLGAVPCAWAQVTAVEFAKYSTSPVGAWMEVDYVQVSQPNIVSIGDSHCAGATLFNPNRALNLVNPDSSWQRYTALYQDLRNNLIVNKGIGSQTSAQLLSRVSDATSQNAKVVFLHASSNDVAYSISKASRTASIQATVDAITASGASCILLNALYNTQTEVNNPAHRDYMRDWWNTDRIGLNGVSMAVDIMQAVTTPDEFLNPALAQADKVHLTPSGYAAVGALLTGLDNAPPESYLLPGIVAQAFVTNYDTVDYNPSKVGENELATERYANTVVMWSMLGNEDPPLKYVRGANTSTTGVGTFPVTYMIGTKWSIMSNNGAATYDQQTGTYQFLDTYGVEVFALETYTSGSYASSLRYRVNGGAWVNVVRNGYGNGHADITFNNTGCTAVGFNRTGNNGWGSFSATFDTAAITQVKCTVYARSSYWSAITYLQYMGME